MRRLRRLTVGWALALVGGACAPPLDWREVRPEGSGATAVFPCKPSSHSRKVSLGGVVLVLTLYACDAADVTYAVAFSELPDPTRVGPTLEALVRAARDNIQAAASSSPEPLHVDGMTPNPQALLWRFDGRRHDGRAVQEQVAVFVHGTRVFQATAVGRQLDAQALETFFGGLRIRS